MNGQLVAPPNGCSILEDKLLPAPVRGQVYWHIDRFDSPACPSRGGAGKRRCRRSWLDVAHDGRDSGLRSSWRAARRTDRTAATATDTALLTACK